MRKAAVGSFFVLACACAPSLAQESLDDQLKVVFATRAAKAEVAAVTPGRQEAARVTIEPSTGSVENDDCPPVDPAKVRQLIHAISAEEGLDADLAEAVAGVESAGGDNPGLSSAGAAGVMQLMPGTASDLGVKDRCDTEANIRGGIRYLKQLLGEFGDPVLALSAYNAGSSNVYKASGIPLNDETVKYIAKVLNRWKYSRMLSPKKQSEHAATVGQGNDEATTDDSENVWRDGHVIDFN